MTSLLLAQDKEAFKITQAVNPNQTFPIHAILNTIVETLAVKDEIIIEAPPGAGKTSFVPLALIAQAWLNGQKIIMLQPRRIAARSAAQRMAALLGEPVGRQVGYKIRQESCVSKDTRIIVMTEGILLRQLQQDPELSGIGAVIFDEFHERSVDSDVSFTLCSHSRDLLRDTPLKLIVMSATLQGMDLSPYLNDAAMIRCQGRTFPVDQYYRVPKRGTNDAIAHAAQVMTEVLKEQARHALVFLPGRGEITRLQRLLEHQLPAHFLMFPLHGSLPPADQKRAIEPLNPTHATHYKIILATDIAETSLTIEGVDLVIDLGLARVPQYDPRTGLTRLKTQKISKASSIQRAGRAGRLRAGVCYRLWGESEQQSLAENYNAQILQADMAPILLNIYAWGVDAPENLPWIDPPPQGNIDQAHELLLSLDAIEINSMGLYSISSHGHTLAALPTHPRLAHMIIKAASLGMGNTACAIAALLSERDTLTIRSVDFSLRMDIVLGDTPCPTAHKPWLNRVKKQTKQFINLCPKHTQQQNIREDALILSLAYPERIAKRIDKASHRYKMSNGRVATLRADDPLTKADWLVIVEAGGQAHQQTDNIYSAVILKPEHFNHHLQHLIATHDQTYWDVQRGRFISERIKKIGAITYHKEPLKTCSDEDITHAIITYLEDEGYEQLPWNMAISQWQSRVMLLRKFDQDNPWPDVSHEHLRKTLNVWLAPYLTDVTNQAGLNKLPLKTILHDLLPWPLPQKLTELAPEKIHIPSGSEAIVDYTHSPPVLAVKLQEMFGCMDTPAIINGKVKLMMHLLSPARRPLQITQDLAGFWESSYQAVKKDMKGRYPKHPWPDDPSQATATRFTKKRR